MNLKLYVMAMKFLHLLDNSVALHLKFRSNVELPYALNGGSGMWQRLCQLRRDLRRMDTSVIAVRERGPKKDPKGYNPVYGFEPYWEFGDWVFDRLRPQPGEARICGSPCPELYAKMGQVCATDKEFTSATFQSYCEMRDRNCNNSEGWTVAYRGPCLVVRIPMPTDPDELVERAENFINGFYKISPTTPAG